MKKIIVLLLLAFSLVFTVGVHEAGPVYHTLDDHAGGA